MSCVKQCEFFSRMLYYGSAMSDQVIDLSVIEELRQLDTPEGDLLKELVQLYLESSPEKVNAIVTSAQSGDLAALRAASHSLKSSSGNLGARHLSDLCQQFEEARTPAELSIATSRVEELRAEFVRVKARLQSLARL
jgi:two-component system sensor histidine kinase/response regulator